MAIRKQVAGGYIYRRSLEVYLHTPLNPMSHRMTMYRQMVSTDEDSFIQAATRDDAPIQVGAAQIAPLTVTYKGLEYTGQEVMEVLALFFDKIDMQINGMAAKGFEQTVHSPAETPPSAPPPPPPAPEPEPQPVED
jgi:hypothetical protein